MFTRWTIDFYLRDEFARLYVISKLTNRLKKKKREKKNVRPRLVCLTVHAAHSNILFSPSLSFDIVNTDDRYVYTYVEIQINGIVYIDDDDVDDDRSS